MKILDSPILELLGDADAGEILHDLLFQFCCAHARLPALRPLGLGAVVVRETEEAGIHHFFNGGFTLRAGVTIAIGKLVAAVAAPDLVLLLGGDHPVALAAADHAGKCKLVVGLWSCASVPSKEHLHPVVFRLGDHRLVLAPIPLATPFGILEGAVVEGFGEDLVDGAFGERFAAHLAGWPRLETPLLVRHVENPWRGVEAGEHQIPHAPDERESLRVFDEAVFAGQLVRVVQVTGGGDPRIPAVFDLGLEPPLHVLAQVIDVFLGHAESPPETDERDSHQFAEPQPSEADIKVTRDLIRAGQFLKIEVLDHVIVGNPAHASLRESGYFYQ